MKKNKTNLQKHFAIISFIWGIISLTILILLVSMSPNLIVKFFLAIEPGLFYGTFFTLSLISIILGGIGIKSERKIFAILGILLSFAVLLRTIPAIIFIFFYNP